MKRFACIVFGMDGLLLDGRVDDVPDDNFAYTQEQR
ncbi:MAG: hypothetical protein ACI9SB_001152 [Candidatus Azotimanducaceae bacterium]|jgi:hypothetical protein